MAIDKSLFDRYQKASKEIRFFMSDIFGGLFSMDGVFNPQFYFDDQLKSPRILFLLKDNYVENKSGHSKDEWPTDLYESLEYYIKPSNKYYSEIMLKLPEDKQLLLLEALNQKYRFLVSRPSPSIDGSPEFNSNVIKAWKYISTNGDLKWKAYNPKEWESNTGKTAFCKNFIEAYYLYKEGCSSSELDSYPVVPHVALLNLKKTYGKSSVHPYIMDAYTGVRLKDRYKLFRKWVSKSNSVCKSELSAAREILPYMEKSLDITCKKDEWTYLPGSPMSQYIGLLAEQILSCAPDVILCCGNGGRQLYSLISIMTNGGHPIKEIVDVKNGHRTIPLDAIIQLNGVKNDPRAWLVTFDGYARPIIILDWPHPSQPSGAYYNPYWMTADAAMKTIWELVDLRQQPRN